MAQPTLTRRRMLEATIGGALGLSATALLAACGASTAPRAASTAAAPATSASAASTAASPALATATPASSLTPAQATAVALQNAPIASQPPPGAANSTPDPKSKGSLVWLVRAGTAENTGQRQVFLPAAAKLLPGVQIEYNVIANDGSYGQKILTMAASGTPPDIWGFGQNYLYYWAIGLPQALDEYINADKWDVDNYFLPGLMNIFKVHGKHYGLSQDTTFGNLGFYNKEMLQQAGVSLPPYDWEDTSWTVDTMLDTAHRLTKNAGQPSAVFGVNWNIANGPDSSYLWGDDAWKPEHYQNFIAQESQLTNPGVTDAFQFRQDLLWKERVMANTQDNKTIGNIGDFFRLQRTAMLFGGGWNFWGYNDVKNFTVGVCAVPGKKANKVTNFDDFWIMARASKAKDAAWAFLRMLTNADIAADYGLLTGVPITPKAAYEKWLPSQATFHKTSVDDLKKVTLGAIDPKRTQESTDHLFLDWATISKAFNDGVAPIYNENKGPVASVMPGIKSTIDGVLRSIYDRYTGKLPTD
mgnify:CR=1 FL=1